MNIETEIPYIDETLASWETQMGNEYLGYRNHVYRMVNIAFHLHPCTKEEKRKIVIAGIFHDLSIWEKQTMDYLDPSIAMALAYLGKNNLEDWTLEFPLVEIFRRADWVDFSLGLFKFGMSSQDISKLKTEFPNAKFHVNLTKRVAKWLLHHPLRPVPMLKL